MVKGDALNISRNNIVSLPLANQSKDTGSDKRSPDSRVKLGQVLQNNDAKMNYNADLSLVGIMQN